MSRMADVSITVSGHARDREDPIFEAVELEWQCDYKEHHDAESEVPEFVTPAYLSMGGSGNITFSLSNEEFAHRVAKAVWRANGAFCKVSVEITEPSDPDVHEPTQWLYDAMLKEDAS